MLAPTETIGRLKEHRFQGFYETAKTPSRPPRIGAWRHTKCVSPGHVSAGARASRGLPPRAVGVELRSLGAPGHGDARAIAADFSIGCRRGGGARGRLRGNGPICRRWVQLSSRVLTCAGLRWYRRGERRFERFCRSFAPGASRHRRRGASRQPYGHDRARRAVRDRLRGLESVGGDRAAR